MSSSSHQGTLKISDTVYRFLINMPALSPAAKSAMSASSPIPPDSLLGMIGSAVNAVAAPVLSSESMAKTFGFKAPPKQLSSIMGFFGTSTPLMKKLTTAALMSFGSKAIIRFAASLYQNYWKGNSYDKLNQNVQDLQTTADQTALTLNSYSDVLGALRLLNMHFSPGLLEADQRLSTIATQAASREEEAQTLASLGQKVDLSQFETSLDYFMQELSRLESTHQNNILVFAEVLPNMQQTEERLNQAKLQLQTAEQEMTEALQELKLIEQDYQLQDDVLNGMIQKAKQLLATKEV